MSRWDKPKTKGERIYRVSFRQMMIITGGAFITGMLTVWNFTL